jgi:hypothetical protein
MKKLEVVERDTEIRRDDGLSLKSLLPDIESLPQRQKYYLLTKLKEYETNEVDDAERQL